MSQFDRLVDPHAAPPRPGRGLMFTGGALIVAALLIGVLVVGVFALNTWQFVSGDMLARAAVPGAFDVQIDQPDTYTIYYEHRSVVNGRTFRTASEPPTLSIAVTDPAGEPVSLDEPRFAETYESPSHQGQSLFQFQASTPGTYRVEVTGPGPDQAYVMAVGDSQLGTFFIGFAGLLCGGPVAAIMLIIGVVLLIIGVVQRTATPRNEG